MAMHSDAKSCDLVELAETIDRKAEDLNREIKALDNLTPELRTILERWPTFDEAIGCVNCNLIYRAFENGRCPHCGSEVFVDVAAVLRGLKVWRKGGVTN
jgi:hypothetical protein